MTRRSFTVSLALAFVLAAAGAQASGQTNLQVNSVMSMRDKVNHVLADWCLNPPCGIPIALVYQIPAMDEVTIVNVTYDEEDGMTADLFYPPGIVPTGDAPGGAAPRDGVPGTSDADPGERLPVFIMPMGFQLSHWFTSHTLPPRDHVSYIEIMSLFAAYGMVAITYDTERIDAGLERLIEFLARHQDELGLDTSRIGLYAWSGHGRLSGRAMGSRVLADRLKCVVSMHSDIQAMVLPRRPLGFYVIHSGGTAIFDEYGMAFARRVSALGHDTAEISDAPSKGFESRVDTPRTREIVRGAAEFARRWLVERPVE